MCSQRKQDVRETTTFWSVHGSLLKNQKYGINNNVFVLLLHYSTIITIHHSQCPVKLTLKYDSGGQVIKTIRTKSQYGSHARIIARVQDWSISKGHRKLTVVHGQFVLMEPLKIDTLENLSFGMLFTTNKETTLFDNGSILPYLMVTDNNFYVLSKNDSVWKTIRCGSKLDKLLSFARYEQVFELPSGSLFNDAKLPLYKIHITLHMLQWLLGILEDEPNQCLQYIF